MYAYGVLVKMNEPTKGWDDTYQCSLINEPKTTAHKSRGSTYRRCRGGGGWGVKCVYNVFVRACVCVAVVVVVVGLVVVVVVVVRGRG